MSNKELTPHPKADILRAIADGKTIEGRLHNTDWEVLALPLLAVEKSEWELRIKPETMSLAGHEFPAPVREPLKVGQKYWIPRTDLGDYGEPHTWSDHYIDAGYLKLGLIQITREGAIAQAKAMIAAVGGEV